MILFYGRLVAIFSNLHPLSLLGSMKRCFTNLLRSLGNAVLSSQWGLAKATSAFLCILSLWFLGYFMWHFSGTSRSGFELLYYLSFWLITSLLTCFFLITIFSSLDAFTTTVNWWIWQLSVNSFSFLCFKPWMLMSVLPLLVSWLLLDECTRCLRKNCYVFIFVITSDCNLRTNSQSWDPVFGISLTD